MNNERELPSHLLELPGNKAFAELSAFEKKEVLNHMTASEYDELNEAACSALVHAQLSGRNARLRTEMLESFDRYHITGRRRAVSPVWAMAAALAVALSFIGFRLVSSIGGDEKIVTVIDTVYVRTPATPELIYDTVYQIIERNHAKISQRLVRSEPERTFAGVKNDLQVLSVSDFANEENSVKGNSLDHDSLAMNFEYVPL
jgi:hypothetical protein